VRKKNLGLSVRGVMRSSCCPTEWEFTKTRPTAFFLSQVCSPHWGSRGSSDGGAAAPVA